ncbi:hypothetical protein [Levilactobacillus enshiensis]|uniref:hypothetical protein n=1 Tax=Levilactobacillus enshiensis TaxID=2590213 RepID=UPI00117B4996|nr:hypothetical protein [Levilactobacillus enshiensis]
MMTYREAYSKTIANINNRIEDLRKTMMSLQSTLYLPETLRSRIQPYLSADKLTRSKACDLYVESQTKLDYLIELMLFVERDQCEALTGELTDFFTKRDLYWWQSALSLQGNPEYLEHEIISPDYYELARQKAADSSKLVN